VFREAQPLKQVVGAAPRRRARQVVQAPDELEVRADVTIPTTIRTNRHDHRGSNGTEPDLYR
jgi:hypothetical protein